MPFVNITGQRDAYREELLAAERAVLDSGCYIGGPEVKALEAELADFCNSSSSDAEKKGFWGGKESLFTGKDRAEPKTSAITCASGTDALTIALMALGLKPGDEVIVPDFTFIAPAECVAFLGGIPRFADIDPETLLIDPESVKALIGPKTRGIIGVDLFGQHRSAAIFGYHNAPRLHPRHHFHHEFLPEQAAGLLRGRRRHLYP